MSRTANSSRKVRIRPFAGILLVVLSGCWGLSAEKQVAPITAGGPDLAKVEEAKSAREFVSLLQERLKNNDRSRVISMTLFPVQVGEIGEILDPEAFRRAYENARLDEVSFTRDYNKVWNRQTVKSVMDEIPDRITWPPGAQAISIGCGEVEFGKTKEGNFRITGFNISEYRVAGISIRDCYRARDFLRQLQVAVGSSQRATVIGMIKYPLRFHGEHKTVIFRSAAELLRRYDLVFSESLRRALADQKVRELIGQSDGLGIQGGYIWFNEPSENSEFKLISIFAP